MFLRGQAGKITLKRHELRVVFWGGQLLSDAELSLLFLVGNVAANPHVTSRLYSSQSLDNNVRHVFESTPTELNQQS